MTGPRRVQTEMLTLAVQDEQFDPADAAGRQLPLTKQMEWLDTPHEVFGGRTPRQAVLEERERELSR